MIRLEYGVLLKKLNDHTRRALEAAAGLCVTRTHYDLELEHLLFKLLEEESGDLPLIFRHYRVDHTRVKKALDEMLEGFKRGNSSTPLLSPRIPRIVQDAWLLGSVDFGASAVRSGHLLLAMVAAEDAPPLVRKIPGEFNKISVEDLRKNLPEIVKSSPEDDGAPLYAPAAAEGAAGGGGPIPAGKQKALAQFTLDLTQQARDGKIDPIVGRDSEIRDVIDILIRRRKNNPMLIGDAGVGKTAVVEGLALRLAAGDVPDMLKNVSLRTLDLGSLQAGAGVRGEFENRLKNVIKEVTASPQPIILFIDEIHTLMGAGGPAGAGDAANLLKPALARGELRTIGATTRSEHKQFIAKDAALDRRFQTIEVDEPGIENASRMIRSLAPRFEGHHGVRVLEDAVRNAVVLSSRYITGRQLPDKAVDLLDTACARVALAMTSTPPDIDDAQRQNDHLDLEIQRLERELRTGESSDQEALDELKAKRSAGAERMKALQARWTEEKKRVTEIRKARDELEKAEGADRQALQEKIAGMIRDLEQIQGEEPLVNVAVDGQAVAKVVSAWTGVPVGKMVRDEMQSLLALRERLGERVIGQEHALRIIADRLKTARYNLQSPDQPIGSFLLVGPSGVGKTETALALSDVLFGGEHNVITINMSEYKEQHSSARLIGPPPGYAGFGKGGVLTEKVRHRPYSVVLLDEIEKAHPDVREFFQQVFDKGFLADTEGHIANFRNTVIIMTANIGGEVILDKCYVEDEEGNVKEAEPPPSPEELMDGLQAELLRKFSASLLARLTVVPFYPIREDVLKQITRLKLRQIADRLAVQHRIAFEYSDAVVDQIASRCTDVQSGARNVNHIVAGTILPEVAQTIIGRLADGQETRKITLDVAEDGNFIFQPS
ncbi:MAG: type VI secretion system ATPase TssH [Planctomycetes bacterium]|nr:type VI secretion system ATPase TssH [Planctomycetota bacterium]